MRALQWVGIAAAMLAAPAPAFAADGRLHAVLLIDTDAGLVGGPDDVHRPAQEANLRNLRGVIDQVVEGQPEKFGGRVFVTVLKGKEDLRPENVKRTLRGLPTDGNSTVLVYYSGHGGTDSARGHFFAASGGHLLRSDLREILAGKGLRAGILISDCCSSFGAFTPPERGPAKWKLFRNLFFESHGLVDVTAATEGQFGWCDAAAGGFFTDALARVLCTGPGEVREDGVDGFVSWDTLFMKVRHETEETFQRAKREAREGDQIKASDAQTPQAFSLGDERRVFLDGQGHYWAVDGTTWIEDWRDGTTVGRFEETARTRDYVELYHPGARTHIRLQDNQVYWSKEPGKWYVVPNSKGAWDRGRAAFLTRTGYVWRAGGDVWISKQTRDPQFISVLRETARTADYVEMYASDRKMYVRFFNDKGLWSLDRERWQPWAGSDGRWLTPDK